MPEPNSIISLGELTKPATILIEKISDAIGGVFRPFQTRRMAKAEADAAITRAEAEIKITDLQRRAMQRLFIEEGQKQENIENITRKALPDVAAEAKPEEVDQDWIANFFDKSRLTSDEDMQTLWARILAGEANKPGSYSKRTVSLLASMDKSEAELFVQLCSFVWHVGSPVPLIYDIDNELYTKAGITYGSLQHLELIGLIKLDHFSGFSWMMKNKNQIQAQPIKWLVRYFNDSYMLKVPIDSQKNQYRLPVGSVVFTAPGIEIASIAGSSANEEFRSYILNRWSSYEVSKI